MLTYPIPSSSIIGNATVAQTIAFLKSPTLLARRLADILSAENFMAHAILQQRYTITGGVLAYFEDETVLADETPETVAPGGNFPDLTLSEDALKMLAASKVGFGTRVTDEAVGRETIAPLDRALAKLANTLVSDFDTKTLSVIQSAATGTLTGAAWTTGKQIVADVAKAKAQIRNQKLGYVADTVVLSETQWAAVVPTLLELLPREADSPLVTGSFPSIMGVTWLTSSFLPANWAPLIFDATNLGGIGHEAVPSQEYASVATVVPNDASNVEVARYRGENDSTRIVLRKCDVPVVRNPKAGVQITGTGL